MTKEAATATAGERSMCILLNMLRYRRPAGSKTERKFIEHFIAPLGTVMDQSGNHSIRIGDAPVMWSSHTDTVHQKGGKQYLAQISPAKVGLHKSSGSNCLGADDTAGVWLMREMILAQVPGLYVFHRAEEKGGVGSEWIAKHNPKFVEGIKFAIALDRKGYTDIITNQRGWCCSDEFAASLGDQLGMGYKASSNGVFTDTANYTKLIGECTNLSVGYEGHHTKGETLDVLHLRALRQKLIHLDVSKLVSKRTPGEVKTYTYTGSDTYYGGDYGGYYGSDGLFSYYDRVLKKHVSGNRKSNVVRGTTWHKNSVQPLHRLVANHADIITEFLEEQGYTACDVEKEIERRLGYVRQWYGQHLVG